MKDMIKFLPGYYRKSQVLTDMYSILQAAFENTEDYINAEDLKLFITTTDDFTRHEKDVGLSSVTADIETKRSRILARLCGNDVLTVSALIELVTTYDKTGCTISEDYANYTVTIIFSGRTGTPYNIDEIKAAVEEVKPAHIQIEYEYITNTWGDAKSKLGTWGAASAYTWGGAKYYDGRTWLYVDDDETVYLREDGANAYVVYTDNEPYARLL